MSPVERAAEAVRLLASQAKGDTLPFCLLEEELRAFVLPSEAALDRARVVVCSCTGAGDSIAGVSTETVPPCMHLCCLVCSCTAL